MKYCVQVGEFQESRRSCCLISILEIEKMESPLVKDKLEMMGDQNIVEDEHKIDFEISNSNLHLQRMISIALMYAGFKPLAQPARGNKIHSKF